MNTSETYGKMTDKFEEKPLNYKKVIIYKNLDAICIS
jgi:hypothetical protein